MESSRTFTKDMQKLHFSPDLPQVFLSGERKLGAAECSQFGLSSVMPGVFSILHKQVVGFW